MTKKAVDVVLLPDEAMTDRTIRLNRELVEKFGSEIILGKTGYLPHISLAMGCADEKDITAIGQILKAITQENPPGNLRALGIVISTNAVGEKTAAFEVERTEQLQMLHENVMTELAQYLTYDVTEDMICQDIEIAESTLLWIRNYPEKSSFENFRPHITLGYGRISQTGFPIEFTASQLALCHLGNHCTCGKILFSISLS
jgi:2'-5' RNA ligase